MLPHAAPDPAVTAGTNGQDQAQPVGPVAVPPLAVSGLVVTKAALLAALSVYVPQITDIESLEGGRFLLIVTDTNQGSA